MIYWLSVIGALVFGLYIGSAIVRHVINFIIIWVLKIVGYIIKGLVWLFEKIDGIGRKKSGKNKTKGTKEESSQISEDEVADFFRKNNITVSKTNG